jgi:peptidoglycan/LPS O-acetylase OafA/YrhL
VISGRFAKLFFFFFCGASFYVLKEHICLTHRIFGQLITALLISAIVNKHIFFYVYTLSIGYVLLYIAYIPYGYIRRYNRLGDYSFGIYIYAFPIQQSVVALCPTVSVPIMILISAPASALLAVISWHLLESRVIGLKKLYVRHTSRFIENG